MAAPLIAVVNDDTAFLQLMHDLLTEEGYRARIVKERQDAHGVIRNEHPDLVILDIRMDHPESGWTVLELIRLDPETAQIPVIVCSADHRFLQAKAEMLQQHHCGVLEKPFDLTELLSQVAAALAPGAGS